MSETNINKLYVDFVKSNHPYTTIHSKQAFEAGYKLMGEENERLKKDIQHGCSICATNPEVTIRELEKENARLREALEEISKPDISCYSDVVWFVRWRNETKEKASKALNQGKEE